MPKTIINLKTFMCPLGIGNPNGECRFHVSENNLEKFPMCPTHGLVLEKTTDALDKMTVTIISEEEVDNFVEIDGLEVRTAEADSINQKLQAEGKQAKEIKPLSAAKKNELKAKIRADIAKFKALED